MSPKKKGREGEDSKKGRPRTRKEPTRLKDLEGKHVYMDRTCRPV